MASICLFLAQIKSQRSAFPRAVRPHPCGAALRVLVLLLLLHLVFAGGTALCVPGTRLLDHGTSGGATAKASVTYCANEASPTATGTELGGCQRKLMVEITLDDSTVAGSLLETDVVVSTAFHLAAFAEDEAASTATTLQVTFAPLRIAFRRGGVQMRYALDYLREFPAALRDSVRLLRVATYCDDGVTRCPAYTPIVGNGDVVPAPMGICCLCTKVACAITNEMCNASMRTHFCFRTAAAGSICVQEDGVRYGGWSIRPGTPYYTLNTTVSGAEMPTTTFHVSTDVTDVQQGTSRLQLLQTSDVNMAEAGLRLNVSQRILFNPLSGDRAIAGVSEWMLVPTTLVTVPGTECNKVGITPEYFYSLSSATQCSALNGTCLANQLDDLRAADLAAIAQGGGGSYLAAYLGAFTQQTVGSQSYLLDEVERSGGATLRWSVDADALTFTAVPVPGSLLSARYLAGAATVSITVSNPGAYAGQYGVAMRNCTAGRVTTCGSGGGGGGDGVRESCVTSLLVRGQNVGEARFQVSAFTSESEGSMAACTVELRDAAHATLGSLPVRWMLETTTTTTVPPLTKWQRCQHCAFHDLRCLFGGVCEWQMLVWTVVALVVMWCPYTILAHWRRVWRLCRK